jgi:uncharacterized membrane protein
MFARLGSALVLIGLIVLVVFLVTSTSGQANYWVLLAGAGVCILGLRMRRRPPEETREPARFKTVRKILTPPDEDAEDD